MFDSHGRILCLRCTAPLELIYRNRYGITFQCSSVECKRTVRYRYSKKYIDDNDPTRGYQAVAHNGSVRYRAPSGKIIDFEDIPGA